MTGLFGMIFLNVKRLYKKEGDRKPPFQTKGDGL
jgi:hypothetical protein